MYLMKVKEQVSMSVGDGPGGLACCNSWGRKESDATELTEVFSHLVMSDSL